MDVAMHINTRINNRLPRAEIGRTSSGFYLNLAFKRENELDDEVTIFCSESQLIQVKNEILSVYENYKQRGIFTDCRPAT